MRNIKKLLAALLALMMILGLWACGKEAEPTTPAPTDGQIVEEEPEASIGAVTLAGTTRVTLHYDAEGNILLITNSEDAACFSQLLGEPCDKAVTQILQESSSAFADTFLLIKQKANTLLPNESFLQTIADTAKKELGDLPILLSAAEDQDEHGYFSAKTAQAVLSACLGDPAGTSYDVLTEAEDGYYTIAAISATSTVKYTVGALYGSVEPQLEIDDEFVESENDYIDFDALLDYDPSGEAEQPTEEPPAQG